MKSLVICIYICVLSTNLIAQEWIPLNGPKGYEVYCHIVTKKTNELMVLTSSGEVMASADKGRNWNDLSKGIVYEKEFWKTASKFHETLTGKLFLLYAKRFYEFNFASKSWDIRNDSISLDDFSSGTNGIIYAGNITHFYVSENDGISFKKIADWSAHKL